MTPDNGTSCFTGHLQAWRAWTMFLWGVMKRMNIYFSHSDLYTSALLQVVETNNIRLYTSGCVVKGHNYAISLSKWGSVENAKLNKLTGWRPCCITKTTVSTSYHCGPISLMWPNQVILHTKPKSHLKTFPCCYIEYILNMHSNYLILSD